jgi:predicted ATPase
VTGEQEYAVPPLVHEEGVGFFLVRARAIDPSFEVDGAVSEICRRVDDLPLALELAAARVKALSTSQILERLEQRLPLLTGGARDLPKRQRTLRATIEWSYELLTPEEQQLFARHAVFRGGCTLEAAEKIADATVDTLQSLVDKSLVRHTRNRYSMHTRSGKKATSKPHSRCTSNAHGRSRSSATTITCCSRASMSLG